MTNGSVIEETVRFRPKARLLHVIGGDLIKDEMAGVVELVKNAYDADAAWVRISFKSLNDMDEATLIVEDNGHGMGRFTLENSWLSPAAGNKGLRRISPGGRSMQGRKGVGRFSAMRIGDNLILETIPGKAAPDLDSSELGNKYRLELNWEGIKDSEEYLDQLGFSLQTFEGVDSRHSGVYLEITQLRDRWGLDRIKRLVHELKLLLSPFPLRPEDDVFEIHLNLEDSELLPEVIRRFHRKIEPYGIPDIADYEASAKIDKFGRYEFSFVRELWANQDPVEAEMVKTGDDIRSLFRKDEIDDLLSPAVEGEEEELPCGPLRVRFVIWDRDIKLLQSKAARLSSDVETLGIREIRGLLNNVSGISIYRDDFRVRPYGDEDKDWLGLGRRRVQLPPMRIGPNQLFGIVDISSVDNPELDDKASREGLKENEAYRALRASLLSFLAWIQPMRYHFRARHLLGRPEPDSTRAIIEKRKETFESLRGQVTEVVSEEKARRKVFRLINSAEKTAEREHKRFSEQARLLHDTHALGLLARFVLHEGRNLNGTFNSGLNNIERLARRGTKGDPPRIILVGRAIVDLDSNLESTRIAVCRLDAMLDQLDPLTKPRRFRRSYVPVEDTISKVHALLEPDMRKAGIRFFPPRGSNRVRAWEADLFHALYNLLHNSIYWVQIDNPPDDREIEIKVQAHDGRPPDEIQAIEIIVSDNGRGISALAAPCVFDLGYTEKPDGYGVGLFIAREALERSGGTIELMNPGEKGARLQMVLQGVSTN